MKFFDRIRAFFSETFGSSDNRRYEATRATREYSYRQRSYEGRASDNRSSQASFTRSTQPCFRPMPTPTSTRLTETSSKHSAMPQSSSRTETPTYSYTSPSTRHTYSTPNTSKVESLPKGKSFTRLNLNNVMHSAMPQSASHAEKPPFAGSYYKTPSTRDTYPIPQYSLKNFTFKVESSPKDKSFTPLNSVMYHNQWTTCNALIVDQLGNPMNTADYAVEAITSNSTSSTEFRNAKLQNGGLQFSMKASNAHGTVVTIIIKINKNSRMSDYALTLTQHVNVSCNPCSNILSEITIKEIDTNRPNDECVFRVSIVDIWGYRAVWSSQENCKLEANVLQSENNINIKKCSEGGHLCFDLSVTGDRPWSVQEFEVFLNGKQLISSPTGIKFEVPSEERDELLKQRFEALQDEDYDSIPKFLIFDKSNSRVFIPASPNLDDGQFIPYDDEMLTMKIQPGTGNYHLVCKNATKYEIMGADFAHVNNIKRVLQQKDRLQIEETDPSHTSIILAHCNVSSHLLPACKMVVLHLLRGLYYRKKASEAARVRMDWKKRIDDLNDILSSSSRNSLIFCKYFKDYYGCLMNRYNREACDELFSFFNFDRDESEVDLHGLLVADEEKLELLTLNLLAGNLSEYDIDNTIRDCRLEGNKYSGGKLKSLKKDLLAGRLSAHDVGQFIESCHSQSRGRIDKTRLDILERDLLRRCERSKEVGQFITKCRSESDEAIRKLEDTLENFNLENAAETENSPWIEIIVGAGHHSKRKEKQNIRPKVEKFLKERGNTFTPVNKGSLVVTFVKYTGPEPCFGEYYCEQCDRCWKSSKSYAGKYQQCSRCRLNCWPVKQREKEKILNYRRDGMQERRKAGPHQYELCQRCRELGYPCNEDDY